MYNVNAWQSTGKHTSTHEATRRKWTRRGKIPKRVARWLVKDFYFCSSVRLFDTHRGTTNHKPHWNFPPVNNLGATWMNFTTWRPRSARWATLKTDRTTLVDNYGSLLLAWFLFNPMCVLSYLICFLCTDRSKPPTELSDMVVTNETVANGFKL